MREGGNILDEMFRAGGSEEGGIMSYLFPKKLAQKKQVTEVTPDLIWNLSIAGMFQKRWKSRVWHDLLDEFYTLEESKDRKSRVEIVEVGLATRRGMESPDEP